MSSVKAQYWPSILEAGWPEKTGRPGTTSVKVMFKDAFQHFVRAIRLLCPECGVSPLFVPLRRVRSLWDWLTPLDGCPRCGYAYKRESGYFLLPTLMTNLGIVGGLGLSILFFLRDLARLSLWQKFFLVLGPMLFLSLLLARHSKSLWLAGDHYLDPHSRADNDHRRLR